MIVKLEKLKTLNGVLGWKFHINWLGSYHPSYLLHKTADENYHRFHSMLNNFVGIKDMFQRSCHEIKNEAHENKSRNI